MDQWLASLFLQYFWKCYEVLIFLCSGKSSLGYFQDCNFDIFWVFFYSLIYVSSSNRRISRSRSQTSLSYFSFSLLMGFIFLTHFSKTQCANLIGSEVPIKQPPRNLYASPLSILLKLTKSSFYSPSSFYSSASLLSSKKSNISSSESFLTQSLKSIIVSSLARAQTCLITSSFSFAKISSILKVALVISYCLT